ncbi:MAG: hypothetical protein ICV60_08650 [Pyrinomonadaceae bacterium]|nr:hypothetical protein [Pyrinomonadaceae bacterium]
MQPPQPPRKDTAHCPICRARLNAALPFCAICGAQLDDDSAREEEELRGVLYLLSELEAWESSGQIAAAEAVQLRAIYQERRDRLRDELAARADGGSDQTRTKEAAASTATQTAEAQPSQPASDAQTQTKEQAPRESEFVAFPPPRHPQQPPVVRRPQRTLLERLADPQTLRLLLYMGAGMLVVGVVIWLRDLLYLKLQEPVVQASLLASATLVFIASGWYTILRTRSRWTGRALTLAGSLLVPVNFWFLVRSGLIENRGRAWAVCAFCALLYAHTAAILRERLYVYMACVASVATLWALILRDAPQASGLYALSLMTASLIFIHLSQLFHATKQPVDEQGDESARSRPEMGRWSRELWSVPLVRTALAFAALAAFIYLPLRFLPGATSFYDGSFRLRSSTYNAGIALLILAAAAYVLWFAGRYAYLKLSVAFYTTSALLFFLTVWAACDGFRLSAQATVLALSVVTLPLSLIARNVQARTTAAPLHYASLIVVIFLAIASVSVVLNSSGTNFTQSAALALVAASFAALSSPRLGTHVEQTALAHFAALYVSASYFVAVASASIKSETSNSALCALWPVALFILAELTLRIKRETQLSAPFTRVADTIAMLAFLWGGFYALLIHLMSDGGSSSAAIVVLGGVALYGAVRAARSRSVYGAALGTLASVVMTAALLDALQKRGAWPSAWPIAAGVIVFAFLFEKVCARLLRASDDEAVRAQSMMTAIRGVLDSAVAVCALLWLITAFDRINTGGFAAASVLLLALLYWIEHAARMKSAWLVRLACAHAGAFLIALLIAFRVDPEWLLLVFTLIIFPAFFILSRYARAHNWLRAPLNQSAVVALLLAFLMALVQAGPHLQPGNAHLLSPSLTTGAVALLSFVASILSRGRASVLYFRAGLWVAVVTLMLASLRAGFDPISDIEVYSTPIALLILVIAYLSHRRAWEEYDQDVGALLWMGSLLLAVPLLARSLEFRLLLDSPAPWRDVAVLAASLALILYGVIGRMRAPVIVGSFSLVTELVVLTLTSVNWLQVPLKYYLITVGALLLLIFGTLEYRREQFLSIRKRFQERRERAREQFGEWR